MPNFLLPAIWSENRLPQVPDDFQSSTAESYQDILDLIFSHATGGLKYLQAPTAHYRVTPSVRTFDLKLPSVMRRANSGTIGWADLPLSVESTRIILRGSESIVPNQEYPMPEGSTEGEVSTSHLEERLTQYFNRLVHEAADEVFVDGMESAFSNGISMAVETYGDIAVYAIKDLISSDRVDAEAVGETLRQLGSKEDPRTHHSRLVVLMSNLWSLDPRIRDAASIGLAALDDPAAIEHIRDAIDRELSPQLRRNLTLVLDQLQAT